MQEDKRPDPRNLTFSQAQGYENLPGPLALEELNDDARRGIWDLLYMSVDKYSRYGLLTFYWPYVGRTLHSQILKRPVEEFSAEQVDFLRNYRSGILEFLEFNKVFDLVQIIMRHPQSPPGFTEAVKDVFEQCQLAYYVDTNEPPTIIPMSTRQEGQAITDAIYTLSEAGLKGAEAHLRKAAELINEGDWSGSIRESIHSVESVARRLTPVSAKTLEPALKSLQERHLIHPALKESFSRLYGYTSDEEGIRHALLDSSDSPSGRDEAVFMLGACASFTSYLWRVTRESDG